MCVCPIIFIYSERERKRENCLGIDKTVDFSAGFWDFRKWVGVGLVGF